MTQTWHQKDFPSVWGECSYCQMSKGGQKVWKKQYQLSLCSCPLASCQCLPLPNSNQKGARQSKPQKQSPGHQNKGKTCRKWMREVIQGDDIAGGGSNLSLRYLYVQEGQRSHLGHRTLQGQDAILQAENLSLNK